MTRPIHSATMPLCNHPRGRPTRKRTCFPFKAPRRIHSQTTQQRQRPMVLLRQALCFLQLMLLHLSESKHQLPRLLRPLVLVLAFLVLEPLLLPSTTSETMPPSRSPYRQTDQSLLLVPVPPFPNSAKRQSPLEPWPMAHLPAMSTASNSTSSLPWTMRFRSVPVNLSDCYMNMMMAG